MKRRIKQRGQVLHDTRLYSFHYSIREREK